MSTIYSKASLLQPTQFIFSSKSEFQLESGKVLSSLSLAYQTWGKLNEDQSNVVWVCHALTGNHRVQEWWGGLFGAGKCFDPAEYFIVAVNVLGSAYGSTGPLSTDLLLEEQFDSFPVLTIRDMVFGLELVRKELKIEWIHTLIGASLGGQQLLEWALLIPEKIGSIIPIATNLKHSPFGIAFNEAQRLAIQADSTFYSKQENGGIEGLKAARAIGMLSYRTYEGYKITQSEETDSKFDSFKASSYQKYQGEKLANRFNAFSYWVLSKAMDSHNVFRNRDEKVLGKCLMPALVIGIDTDLLFPITEQEELTKQLPNARLIRLKSDFGHDGFLVETEILANHITQFLKNN
ncbi:homoserine O-acetyltransferase family protein [Fluviicola taffensis]|uniref:Homoserine O-acetyltransferase n=1 Tax=Fluviicola taffensis (strain DSM 16823 / NCIMB 13979 / RW262) TaxID=755732 RepID=F2IIM6_FLUTR|nr:homoserine O-acetyltransferase [Fluviicola taffensis]AEA45988.1 homoserine O-acetyltransferase [Fluviicola taffensis DSM 16823]